MSRPTLLAMTLTVGRRGARIALAAARVEARCCGLRGRQLRAHRLAGTSPRLRGSAPQQRSWRVLHPIAFTHGECYSVSRANARSMLSTPCKVDGALGSSIRRQHTTRLHITHHDTLLHSNNHAASYAEDAYVQPYQSGSVPSTTNNLAMHLASTPAAG